MRDGQANLDSARDTKTRSKQDDSYLGSRSDDVAEMIRAWKQNSLTDFVYPPRDRYINPSMFPKEVRVYRVSEQDIKKEAEE